MSDIGGVLFIVGLIGLISLGGKVVIKSIKTQDINEIDFILVSVFFLLMVAGAFN